MLTKTLTENKATFTFTEISPKKRQANFEDLRQPTQISPTIELG